MLSKKSVSFSGRLVAVFLTVLFVSSCEEKDPTPVVEGPHAEVNSWIKENMDFWYLWNTELPSNPDNSLAPDAFFESLLSDKDRFSWIQENYQELLNSLQGVSKEAGYEFRLYRESEGSTNVIAQIVYIKPGTSAAEKGLKRGDVISHINGQQITTENYRTLLEEMGENHSIQYKPLDVEQQSLGEVKTVDLTTAQYAENPNYLHKVIDVGGGRKVGYFVYNFFANGTDASPGSYSTQTDNIFGEFKAAGITDLVLDLRFNGGGAESAATNLASLIGKDVDQSKVFAKRKYNAGVEQEILADPDLGEEFLTTRFTTESANIGSMLNGGRVYILTSSRTASASELVINALRPYMDVFLIGDRTYGKNVGSISLYEENDPENTWGMQPIVVKISNSQDQSDYDNGFEPQVKNEDNSLLVYPLGDIRESMLRQAIEQITGVAVGGRVAAGKEQPLESIAHSLDFKRGSFNLIIDDFPVMK